MGAGGGAHQLIRGVRKNSSSLFVILQEEALHASPAEVQQQLAEAAEFFDEISAPEVVAVDALLEMADSPPPLAPVSPLPPSPPPLPDVVPDQDRACGRRPPPPPMVLPMPPWLGVSFL